MYRVVPQKKLDPHLRWEMPERVFFACGACHILAYAFLERYEGVGAEAVWIKPAPGFAGNHVFVRGDGWAFDYHGYCDPDRLLDHMTRKARRWWPGWSASLTKLPREALISEAKSKTYDGLWLREPRQFLHDALPRARRFLQRLPPPPQRVA